MLQKKGIHSSLELVSCIPILAAIYTGHSLILPDIPTHQAAFLQLIFFPMLSKASAKRPATAPLPSYCFPMRSKTFILDILALLPRNLLFLWIRLSFIRKTQALSSLFSICQEKKFACFMSHNSTDFTEHFTSRFCLRIKKTSSKSVEFDQPN